MGVGPADGGRTGTVRGEIKCIKDGCSAYPVKGAEVCHAHGGRLPSVKAQALVKLAVEEFGLPVVKPKEFPDLVGVYVSHGNLNISRLDEAMEKVRLDSPDLSEIELRREYSDIFSEIRAEKMMNVRLMQAAAAIAIAAGVKPVEESPFFDVDEAVARIELLSLRAKEYDENVICGCCERPLNARILAIVPDPEED